MCRESMDGHPPLHIPSPVSHGCFVAIVKSLSHVWLFATPWTAARQASLSFTVSRSLVTLMSIETVMPANRLNLCHSLLPSVFPSIRVFSSESALHIRLPNYWSSSFSISPFNEYSSSFRIDMGACSYSFSNLVLPVMAPTPVLLPGKSHGQRSLVGCSPWGRWVGHNWATSLSLFTLMHWRRKWQPTPVFLPGESQRRGSLVGCRLWGRTESDTTEVT